MPSAPSPTHQRAAGVVELRFGAGESGRAPLRHLFQTAPMRVLFPTPEPGDPPLAALLNVAGGLASGDRLRLAVKLEAGGVATIGTPAAEKVYRSLGPDATVAATLTLDEGAALEWLPQETILFDGARLRRRLDIHLAPRARLLAAETLVFGRAARGEQFRGGFLHDGWRLHRDGSLAWLDALRLDDPAAALDDRFGLGGAEAYATLLYAAEDAAALLPVLRAACGPHGAASVPRQSVLLARWLGPAAPLRAALGGALVAMRAAGLGLSPRPPRLWTT